MGIVIGIGVVVAAIVALFASGYVKSPPDTAYIISGFRKPRILIGKAGFRIPFLERLDKLSLKMFSVGRYGYLICSRWYIRIDG